LPGVEPQARVCGLLVLVLFLAPWIGRASGPRERCLGYERLGQVASSVWLSRLDRAIPLDAAWADPGDDALFGLEDDERLLAMLSIALSGAALLALPRGRGGRVGLAAALVGAAGTASLLGRVAGSGLGLHTATGLFVDPSLLELANLVPGAVPFGLAAAAFATRTTHPRLARVLVFVLAELILLGLLAPRFAHLEWNDWTEDSMEWPSKTLRWGLRGEGLVILTALAIEVRAIARS
jgi:hypothetical protein